MNYQCQLPLCWTENNDIFFFQNRLGLLSGENVNMSRASEYFDFFARTARTILDDDPIDVAASHTKVSELEAQYI